MSSAPSNEIKILVADDEPSIADTLGVILHRAGFEVAVAYNGADAIATAKTFRPDILLSDYAMPGVDGLTASIEIKRILPGCRVIMLSGHSLGDELANRGEQAYQFLLLAKPMHPEDLLHAIGSEQPDRHSPAEPIRILNVDDVEEHRYSITRLFGHAGFKVSEAATGADALRKAIEEKPDLILLDIHLPDTTGFDVCAALKQNPDTAQITVVHLTASATDDAAINEVDVPIELPLTISLLL